jgi:hypothetical protein
VIDEPDDLEAILGPTTAASASPKLPDAIFVQTERVLHRRRLLSRMGKVGSIAAVLALGIGLGRLTVPRPAPGPVFTNQDRSPDVIVVPLVVPVPEISSASPVMAKAAEPATASQAELLAEQADDRGEAARLYRLAGDRYLNDVQDYQNAARCYRLFLSRAGEPALQPEPRDTWLLTSLKNAVFKEKFNVAKIDG